MAKDCIGLAALVATRLCHDLASPIGAISNTADLMTEMGSDQSLEDVQMVARTAERAAQMLQFYRLVFGQSQGEHRETDAGRFVALLRSQEVPGRIGLTIGGRDQGPIPTRIAQVSGLMVMAARVVVGLKGEIRLMLPENAKGFPSIAVKGEKVSVTDRHLALLTDPTVEPEQPKELEFALLRDLTTAADGRIQISHGPNHVSITLGSGATAGQIATSPSL